jgi:hypothetical protein
VLNLTLWTTRELRILLACQEYQEGTFAGDLRRELSKRGGQ